MRWIEPDGDFSYCLLFLGKVAIVGISRRSYDRRREIVCVSCKDQKCRLENAAIAFALFAPPFVLRIINLGYVVEE
jgi:hypothetical protein